MLGASHTWVVAISRKTAGTGSKESHLEWQGLGCLSVASRNPRVMVCLGWEYQGPFPPTSSHPPSQLLPSFPQVLALPTELWQGVQPRAACGRRRHSCSQRAGRLPTNQNTGGQSSQWTEFKHSTAYVFSSTQPVIHQSFMGYPPGAGIAVCSAGKPEENEAALLECTYQREKRAQSQK